MLLTEKECKAICEKLLALTKADDAEVSVGSSDYSHLRFAANGFTTSGRSQSASASITVWIDKKRGSASASDVDDQSLKMAAEQAEKLARISPVDREYVPTLGPQQYKPVSGYAESTAEISLPDRARGIDEIIRSCEKEGVIGAGFHHSSADSGAFATKNGDFQFERSTLVSLSVTARTPDGGSSGYFLRNHFDVAKLDTKRIGQQAIEKALHSKNPKVLEAGSYPVILEPQAAGDLVHFGFDARSADEGRSPYSAPGGKTRVGEKIFDERINVYSDPWHPELPGSSAAQAGIPAEKIHLVRNGVLEQLHYSRYWAKEKGKQATPGPVNTIIESSGPANSLEEMIKAMDRGLLVSRFWYIRGVDPRTALFTGLTRDGVWYIEKGKIQYPVRNFRFNQSILELLAPGNVEMIGPSERISGSESQGSSAAMVPALMVKQFHFTSQSEAV
ncbi:MAG TPA: TldD/PmbA family protein [Verrucomicrobiae bacterium]|jgi:predicted Zn-dependent protease|nr:TldD/PmbA family protein [Verrucomicrobiae bacterium]